MTMVRPSLFVAAAVLLAGSACVPPIAFNDGLPAWAPEASGVEWRVGYQRISAFGADSFDILGNRLATPDFSFSYLTPGFRVGLDRDPLAAEVGLTTAIAAAGNFSALLGGELGLGYGDPNVSVMFRPSLYLFDFYSDRESGTGVDVALRTQATLLVGNGYRERGLNFAATAPVTTAPGRSRSSGSICARSSSRRVLVHAAGIGLCVR